MNTWPDGRVAGLEGSRDWAIKTLADALGIEPGKALEYYAAEAAKRIAYLESRKLTADQVIECARVINAALIAAGKQEKGE